MDTLQSALHTALLDHALVIRRCLSLYYGRSAHVATRAQLVPRFEASFEHELALLFPGQLSVMDFTSDFPSPASEELGPDGRQASEGAIADESAIAPEEGPHPPESAFRRGRRRSLSFLKRGSISSLRGRLNEQGQQQQANGGGGFGDESSGRHSRQQSRNRSASRGRLSLFDRRPSMDSRPGSAGGYGNGHGNGNGNGALKKRLSFLSNGGSWGNATYNNGGQQ
jgi:dedicator of cytokinesis protein 3